jgi:hypothetical protein
VEDWVKYEDKTSEPKLWGREVEGTGLESFSVAALGIILLKFPSPLRECYSLLT